MAAKKPTKKTPAKVGARLKPENTPLGSMPLPRGTSTELTDSERAWLESEVDRIEGLEETIKALAPEDFEMVKQGLGAAIGFKSLQRIIHDIEGFTSLDEWASQEIQYYLRIAQTGFKLALSVGNAALTEQQKLTTRTLTHAIDRHGGGVKRWMLDPKGKAMTQIREEWERRQRPGAAFAREMAISFQKHGVDITEGGIKNAITRWRKE